MDTVGSRRSRTGGLESSKSPPRIRYLSSVAASTVKDLDENFCGCGDDFRRSIVSIEGTAPLRFKRTGFNPFAWIRRYIRIVIRYRSGTNPARIKDITNQAGIFLEDSLKDFLVSDTYIDLVIEEESK